MRETLNTVACKSVLLGKWWQKQMGRTTSQNN